MNPFIQYCPPKNVSFARQSSDIFYSEALRLAPPSYNQAEKDYDRNLGRKIQGLRRESILIQKAAMKEQDATKKAEGLQRAEDLRKEKEALKDKLIERNLRFAFSFANQHTLGKNRTMYPELVSAASIGMMKAAEKYNPEQNPNVTFPSYAKHWMRANINNSLSRNKQIYIPPNSRRLHNQAQEAREMLKKELGRNPSYEELASVLGKKRVNNLKNRLLATNIKQLSINAPMTQGETTTYEEVLRDENAKIPGMGDLYAERYALVRKLFNTVLNERERKILSARYQLNNTGNGKLLTLQEIGEGIGKTHERIRQIENEAIRKLKKAVQGYDL